MKELKYTKNSKFEIIFENLDEVKEENSVLLRLKNGDLTPLFCLEGFFIRHSQNIFIPYISTKDSVFYPIAQHLDLQSLKLYVLDCNNNVPILDTEHIICDYCYEEGKTCDACESIISDKIKICQEDLEKCFGYEDITNILPKWNIPEDNAVLFLSEKDSVKYSANYNTYFTYPDCINAINIIEQNGIDDVDCIKYYKTISIIIPELHAEDQSCPYHIDNINNVCKELKEKYGVERIELFVSHCFLRADDHSLFCYQEDGKMCMNYRPFYDWSIEPPFIYLNFDFLTTTNSTQNIDTYNQHDKNESNEFYKKEKNNYESRLEVIDVIEFFNI